MKIIERIYEELNKQRKTAADLARYIGVTTGQTTAWKQRKTDPPAKYMPQIADFLGLSTDYLLGRDQAYNTQIITNDSLNQKIYEIEKVLERGDVSDDDIELIEFILRKYKC